MSAPHSADTTPRLRTGTDDGVLDPAVAAGDLARELGGATNGDFTEITTKLALSAMRVFPEERTDEDVRNIYTWLRVQPITLKRYFGMVLMEGRGGSGSGGVVRGPSEAAVHLCRHLKLLHVSRGTLMYKQGDVGHSFSFFVILDGNCELMHRPMDAKPVEGLADGATTFGSTGSTIASTQYFGISVGLLSAGECFGELSHLLGTARPESVVSRGTDDGGPTQILQIDASTFSRFVFPVFRPTMTALQRRVKFLSNLHLFATWPQEELSFLAYWMTDHRVFADSPLFMQGTSADYVYFVQSGVVELIKSAFNGTPALVVERVAEAGVIGAMDAVRRWKHRQVGARVVPEGDARVVCMSISLFRKLVLSDLPSERFDSAMLLDDLVESREAWHHLRTSEANDDTAGLGYDLVESVQDRLLPCGWCGEKGHPSIDCTETASPTRGGTPRSGASPASGRRPGSGAGGSTSTTTTSTPVSKRVLSMRSGVDSLPFSTPRSTGRGSPALTGENWLDDPAPQPPTKDEARFTAAVRQMAVVKRAVAAFKRLLTRKKTETRGGRSRSHTDPTGEFLGLDTAPVDGSGGEKGAEVEEQEEEQLSGSLFFKSDTGKRRGRFAARHRSWRQIGGSKKNVTPASGTGTGMTTSSSAAASSATATAATATLAGTGTAASSRTLHKTVPVPKRRLRRSMTDASHTNVLGTLSSPPSQSRAIALGSGSLSTMPAHARTSSLVLSPTAARIRSGSPQHSRSPRNLSLAAETLQGADGPPTAFAARPVSLASDLLNPLGPATSSPVFGDTGSPAASPSVTDGALHVARRDRSVLRPWRLDSPPGRSSKPHGSTPDLAPDAVPSPVPLPHRRSSIVDQASPDLGPRAPAESNKAVSRIHASVSNLSLESQDDNSRPTRQPVLSPMKMPRSVHRSAF